MSQNNLPAQTPPKRKRGSQSASIERNYLGDKKDIGQIVWNSARYLHRKPVKTDDECAQRLDEFFKENCSMNSIPSVEKMALALGVTRFTVLEWATGKAPTIGISHMIKQAKGMLAAIDAELVASRRIPEITYIFRSKNYYGMVDKQEVVVKPTQELGEITDPEEIRAKYLAQLPETT